MLVGHADGACCEGAVVLPCRAAPDQGQLLLLVGRRHAASLPGAKSLPAADAAAHLFAEENAAAAVYLLHDIAVPHFAAVCCSVAHQRGPGRLTQEPVWVAAAHSQAAAVPACGWQYAPLSFAVCPGQLRTAETAAVAVGLYTLARLAVPAVHDQPGAGSWRPEMLPGQLLCCAAVALLPQVHD